MSVYALLCVMLCVCVKMPTAGMKVAAVLFVAGLPSHYTWVLSQLQCNVSGVALCSEALQRIVLLQPVTVSCWLLACGQLFCCC